MITDLKPYPAMEDSGVEWLGELPKSWDVLRSKRLFTPRKELAKPNDVQLSATQAYGVIPQEEYERRVGRKVTRITQHLDKRRHVEVNDFVISMRSFQGGLERAWSEGCIRSSYIVLCPVGDIDVAFYQYLFKSPRYIGALQSTANFIRDGQDLNFENFCGVDLPSPPISEQAAIARYLEHVDRRVRRLVRTKRKLIALLTEQKQAIIHRVVTRGLDPDVPLKDSGVEWLGAVPEHWEVVRLRSVARSVTSGSRGWSSFAADEGPLFVRVANLSRMSLDLRFDDVVRLRLPETSEVVRTRIQPGDLLLSITAYIGSVAVAPERFEEAYVSQHVARCALRDDNHNPRWLGYVLLSEVGQTHGQLSLYGGTKDGLSLDDVKNYPLLLPPREEQDRLVEKIEQEVSQLDSAIGRANQEIDLLNEYRTRLIADVVTGKLDAREAVPALPDEHEEPEPPGVVDGDSAEEERAGDFDPIPEEAEA